MRNSILKTTAVTMLVILCMWQIVTLWLGDMSSHNFLEKKETAENGVLIQPKAVWVNTSQLAYNVNETNNEYMMLINELKNLVVSDVRSSDIEKESTLTYETLLGMQGILYEYGMGFGIEELVGITIDGLKENDEISVSQIFVDMSVYNSQETTLYLVTEDLKSLYKVILYDTLKGHQKMMESFNKEENTQSLIGYQPSIINNKKNDIKGNVFLPQDTKKAPIEYDVLMISNPYEGQSQEKKKELLERDVNSFFTNPLLKEVDLEADGSIIFSEKMRAIVKYDPAGTLEFNITSANQATNLTRLERLTKVMKFIESCTGIPKYLKEGIYLKKIVSQGNEYIYKFDYKYKGFGVLLTDKVKEKLGIDSILQITIKNNQVSGGKWSILEIGELGGNTPITDTLQSSFGEAIDNIYGYYIKRGSEIRKLDTVQCRYIMKDITGRMDLDWTAFYKNHWYIPKKS